MSVLGQSFAALKTRARRQVHCAFAVPVQYYLAGTSSPLVTQYPVTARFSDKIVTDADPLGTGAGYATNLDQVAKVTFDRDQLAANGISPKQLDSVYFPDYQIMATLDLRDPFDGPINDRWSVSLA